VVCLRNEGYPSSLEPRKVYLLLADVSASVTGHVRVIDESGEDYLYPSEYFAEIEVTEALGRALLQAS